MTTPLPHDEALALKPDQAEAWLGRGTVLAELNRSDEAFAAYHKALALKPDLAQAWLGRGQVFTSLKSFAEAFAAYDKALALKPDLAEAWLGRGQAFLGLRRYDEAFAAYDKALALNPDLAEAWLANRVQANQVNDDKTKISQRVPTRSECRLPQTAFVILLLQQYLQDQSENIRCLDDAPCRESG